MGRFAGSGFRVSVVGATVRGMDRDEVVEWAPAPRTAEKSGSAWDRQIKLRDEAMRTLPDHLRETVRQQARAVFEARTALLHAYSLFWDDRGVGEALRAVESWLHQAAESGDGSGPPPDLSRHLR